MPGEDERPIHKHPAALLSPVILTLAGLGAAGALSLDLKHDGNVLIIVWVAWVYVVLHLLYKVYVWLRSSLVVTDKQLILTGGAHVRSTSSIYISKVTGWDVQDSPVGLVLGYKSLVLQIEGYNKEGVRTIGWIPLCAIRKIENILPSTARSGVGEKAFKEWAPSGLPPRRLRLIVALLLSCSMVILAVAVGNHPHIRADLSDQSDVIALLSGIIPVVITLVIP
jgi:Bacterial PH domain